MNVYPVNYIQGATTLDAPSIVSYSTIDNIYHPYMKHRAYFSVTNPQISFVCPSGMDTDTLIIADTNCNSLSVSMSAYCVTFNETYTLERDKINIIPLVNRNGISFTPYGPTITGTLSFTGGTGGAYIGYAFLGKKIELPRFITGPEWETIIRGSSERTNNGQAYGILLPTLDRLRLNWVRIYKDKKKILDDYVQSVQTTIPHIVDLYPEARADFPPRYATIASSVPAQKRNESDFYWNFNIEWLEAK